MAGFVGINNLLGELVHGKLDRLVHDPYLAVTELIGIALVTVAVINRRAQGKWTPRLVTVAYAVLALWIVANLVRYPINERRGEPHRISLKPDNALLTLAEGHAHRWVRSAGALYLYMRANLKGATLRVFDDETLPPVHLRNWVGVDDVRVDRAYRHEIGDETGRRLRRRAVASYRDRARRRFWFILRPAGEPQRYVLLNAGKHHYLLPENDPILQERQP